MDIGADFVVIGSGVAGLRAALSLADLGRVVVLTKADPRESNTGYAQGGIAAALGQDDSPALHASDTINAGDGLCSSDAVAVLVQEGVEYVRELVDWGAAFDRDAQGRLSLAKEAAHSVRRVLHAGDATGREIARLLWSRVSGDARIRILDDALATALLLEGSRCVGVSYRNSTGDEHRVLAACTLLATGGAGRIYRETTNPAIATGDGVAMAFAAGARVADLEFVQFHPTVLSVEGSPRFLLSEALRGEGARLVNAGGEAFMPRYDKAGDLAPRDVVARAIVREAERSQGPIYLTVAHLDASFVRGRFPTIAQACAEAGLDLARDPIPVSPAAHYMMGGVETDLDGRTSVVALFAAGEVACTGVHGANRLASNSLLEGLVFGARAAVAMAASPRPAQLREGDVFSCPPPPTRDAAPSAHEVRDLMWRLVGVNRERSGLTEAVARLQRWAGAAASADGGLEQQRVGSLVAVGLLVARAALRRAESRGAHFRADCPGRDDLHWHRHLSDVRTV